MHSFIYSGTPLLRLPLLREFHYHANIQKAQIFFFFIFVKKPRNYANSQQRQFSPITNLFFPLKFTSLQRQFVFVGGRRRKEKTNRQRLNITPGVYILQIP